MKKVLLATSVVILLFSGCTVRLGNMTAISTKNIDNLNTDVSLDRKVVGESCQNTVFIFPYGDLQTKLQIATENAIDNGRASGLEGDTIINAKIDATGWYIPLIYGEGCVTVKGNLVKLSDSLK